jgi:hypothetical protein
LTVLAGLGIRLEHIAALVDTVVERTAVAVAVDYIVVGNIVEVVQKADIVPREHTKRMVHTGRIASFRSLHGPSGVPYLPNVLYQREEQEEPSLDFQVDLFLVFGLTAADYSWHWHPWMHVRRPMASEC